jgi:UDPglucose--hexose-1-phosphate uridylyltransferase
LLPNEVKECPFCPGHEAMTPPETFSIRPDASKPDQPGWLVRVLDWVYPF